MDEGAVLSTRRNILVVLGVKHGKRAARSVERALNAVEDLRRLEELVEEAPRCQDIDGFREALAGSRPPAPRRRPPRRNTGPSSAS